MYRNLLTVPVIFVNLSTFLPLLFIPSHSNIFAEYENNLPLNPLFIVLRGVTPHTPYSYGPDWKTSNSTTMSFGFVFTATDAEHSSFKISPAYFALSTQSIIIPRAVYIITCASVFSSSS
jgi:hypothetical protein